MSDLVVGLTGGLAAGKSTVAEMLRERGISVIDADEIVADLYAPGGAGVGLIERLLGPTFLDPSGAVDRAAVGGRVFREPDLRAALEAAIHPLIRENFRQRAAAQAGIVALEAALLVETGWGTELDRLITVEAPIETRLERATRRDGSREEAQRRIAAQGPESARRATADYVIENDGDLPHLETQVDDVVRSLRGLL